MNSPETKISMITLDGEQGPLNHVVHPSKVTGHGWKCFAHLYVACMYAWASSCCFLLQPA